MKFVEESEGAFSAAQLAAAERELEEQKKEWELDRLRALREEEERRMRLADDDEKPLTFGREDAQNQVNSIAAKGGSSKRLVSKKLAVPSRRSSRRRGGSRVGRARLESSSESENETTSTESDSESQEEDIVEDSLDEESSHTESQSQGDEEEEGEGGGEKEEKEDEEEEAGEESEDGRANDRDYSERRGGFSRRKGRLAGSGSCSRNHFDLNSPRTRSRGNVQINLWTLDVSPILPGVKPNCRRQRKKFHRAKSEETLFSPSSDACSKRNVRINMSSKVQSTNSHQNAKISEVAEVERNSTRNDTGSNGVEQRAANLNVEGSADDHIDPMTPVVKTQSEQTGMSELNSDNAEKGDVKEKNDEKIVNGTNLITVCSVQVTRCSQKMLSASYRKFEPEVNRNEDAENLNVNVSARDSRSSPSAIQPDASLKRSKESTAKSKSEFDVTANSLCNNNARGKLVTAATLRDSGSSVESSSTRSVPLLRSKTLRNASPDAVDKIPKPVAISRVSIAQRNCKTNADDTRSNLIEDEDKNGTCDDDNDNAELIVSSPRKYTSQRHNSKSDTRDNLNLSVASLQVSEKGTADPVSNVSDSLVASSVKSETNSNESKYKIRRLEVAIPRSVITRSSKIPSVISNHSEESNARLTDDKVDSLLETKSGSQAKTSQGTRKIDLTGSQHSAVEQSRITRSIAAPLTPPPLTGGDEMTNSKLLQKRRPDTPFPRPLRRSAVIVNTPVRVSPSRGEKYVTRNSKQCQDNGLVSPMLFRRSRSIPLMKPEPKETSATVVVSTKRRPDTPRPNVPNYNNEQVSRVTRSGLTLNSSTSSAKSASSPLFPSAASALKTSVKQSRTSPTSSENETPTSLVSPSYEKPQRTAKVVAILTMDMRNYHNSNKTLSSIQPKPAANCETKGQDKEFLVPRLSLRNQETDQESDLSDTKSRRLRRETKRAKSAASCSLENEEGNSDDDSDREPMQKRSFRSHISPSSSSSSTVTATRSDKLRNTTIS